MERARVVGVVRSGLPGSGYAVGGRLVLTSAHVADRTGERVEVFRPGGNGGVGGAVVWCGTPGGRDDAALVLVDDDPAWRLPAGGVRWGRMVTDRPGTPCETWGVPDVAQRPGAGGPQNGSQVGPGAGGQPGPQPGPQPGGQPSPQPGGPQPGPQAGPVEAVQLAGRVNPGSGFAGNQYVMDLLQHPPQWSEADASPWGGLSGAAVFCDGLLIGVVASDRAYSAHGQLNVVPSYVPHHDPAFRAALAEYGSGAAGLEAVEFQRLAEPAVTTAPGGLRSPAAVLHAGRQTVPFHGRHDLLERLLAWCAPPGSGAFLLHGPGGQGKTRLAHHLAGLLAEGRWAVLWPRAKATAAELADVQHAARPLLVVLDYAENRAGQLTALAEAAARHPGTTPLKVLLLARTGGDWWTRAKTATSLAEDLLDTAPAHLLPPLEADPADRPDAYRTAARALADALPDVQGLNGYDWQAAADTLPVPPLLGQDAYGNALTLHMTALADLLDTATPTDPAGPGAAREGATGVEDRLLGHERRYWHRAAEARGLTPELSLDTLENALAAAHLVGAADREQADDTWRRLPALADQTRDRRNAVTAWIAALYPPTTPGQPWGALHPDRLAERHTGRVLDHDPALAVRLLNDADDAQKQQLLTVYSRAAAHPVFDQRLDTRLTGLCVEHHRLLAAQIITTAVRTDHHAPLISALDTLTTDTTTPVGDLTTLHDRFPQSSQRLADTAVHLARTITGHYRRLAETYPDAHLPALAISLNNLSVRLGEVGRREEGLAASQEATGHYRRLAEADPDAHLPALAMSLNNLSVRLGEVGRREEGLAASQEATGHYRRLVEVNPDAYLPDLATSLNNLSVDLGEVGRREEGLVAIEEATGIRRRLAEANPDAHLPAFATSLNNLSIRLGDAGRWEEGLAASQEATGIRRQLAEVNPDAYLPDLATSLNNLSVDLGEVSRREEGLVAIEEATGIRRRLAEANPDAHLPAFATSLNNLSIRLGDARRWEEGLAAIEEATGIRRRLAEVNPDAHLPAFATSLNNLSIRLGDARRWEEGLAAIEEATGHYRRLAQAHPDVHLPALALSLNNLSVRLGDAGRWEEGLAAIQEATDIRRRLAEANPDAYLPDLAMSLYNLSVDLGDAGRREEGLAAIQEVIRIWRTLAQTYPQRFEADLRKSVGVAEWLESLP